MKKTIYILLLSLVFLFVFASCFTTTPTNTITNEDLHKVVLESSDTSTTETWKVQYYVDIFGDPTDSAYIYGLTTGTFSNSATKNSDLYIILLIEENAVGIEFIEYRINNTSQDFDKTSYNLSIKGSDGVVVSVKMKAITTAGSNQRRIRLMAYKEDALVLFNYLCSGEFFKVYMDGDYSSSYVFSLDPKGFPVAYKELAHIQ